MKEWYVNHNLPDESITRFFIGKNISEPRAFGIYYDNAKKVYVVYKNKNDASRVVRYEGTDEPYAVNEIYTRLKEEISNQKSNQPIRTNNYSNLNNRNRKKSFRIGCLSYFIIIIFVIFVILQDLAYGYYIKNNNVYYLPEECIGLNKKKCDCYKYNSETDSWSKVSLPSNISIINRLGEYWKDEYNSKVNIITTIILESGYYVNNSQVYYSYNDCKIFDSNSCEWYKYDVELDSWSIVDFPNFIKGNNYIGYWDSNDNPYKDKIVINKQYKDEEWYKKLHPTPITSGYYTYNNDIYYYYKSKWYIYNNGWIDTNNVSDDLILNHDNYYEYDPDVEESFKDSSYYQKSSNSTSSGDTWNNDNDYDDDWDNDTSWDSDDSWDSGYTDWDSDW